MRTGEEFKSSWGDNINTDLKVMKVVNIPN
jgi:hypothetical protein